jgi:hypothetical protein
VASKFYLLVSVSNSYSVTLMLLAEKCVQCSFSSRFIFILPQAFNLCKAFGLIYICEAEVGCNVLSLAQHSNPVRHFKFVLKRVYFNVLMI